MEEFTYFLLQQLFTHWVILLLVLGYSLQVTLMTPQNRSLTLLLLWPICGAYAYFLVSKSLRKIFLKSNNELITTIEEKRRKKLLFHFHLLFFVFYFLVIFKTLPHALEYDSELLKLVSTLLTLFLFISLYFFCRKEWFTSLFNQASHTETWNRYFSRAIILLLSLVILSDLLGYIYFSTFIAEASLKTLVLFALILVLHKGIQELIDTKLFSNKILQKISSHPIEWKNTFHFWAKTLFYLTFIFSFSRIWKFFDPLKEDIQKFLNLGFQFEQTRISIGLLVSVILTFYLTSLVSRIIRGIFEQNIYPQKRWDPGIRNAISTGIHYLISLMGILIILKVLGFDIRNITVLAGAFGVGLGLGLQNLANNFASGIVLLIERPVKVGDVIQLGEISGKVTKIGARATLVETPDYASVLIPNGDLLSARVINWSYKHSQVILNIPLQLPHAFNLEEGRKLIFNLVSHHPKILKNPPPLLEVKSLGKENIEMNVKAFMSDIYERTAVISDLLIQIEKTLRLYSTQATLNKQGLEPKHQGNPTDQ